LLMDTTRNQKFSKKSKDKTIRSNNIAVPYNLGWDCFLNNQFWR